MSAQREPHRCGEAGRKHRLRGGDQLGQPRPTGSRPNLDLPRRPAIVDGEHTGGRAAACAALDFPSVHLLVVDRDRERTFRGDVSDDLLEQYSGIYCGEDVALFATTQGPDQLEKEEGPPALHQAHRAQNDELFVVARRKKRSASTGFTSIVEAHSRFVAIHGVHPAVGQVGIDPAERAERRLALDVDRRFQIEIGALATVIQLPTGSGAGEDAGALVKARPKRTFKCRSLDRDHLVAVALFTGA